MDWQEFAALRAARPYPFIMAHRGASALLPENTLPAFARALTDGADVLETDLRFTRDEQLVLLHDETLDRTTTGRGPVSNYTLTELKRFAIKAAPDGPPTPEQVPTLSELIAAHDPCPPLALELKDPRFGQARYAAMLIDLLARRELLQRCSVISFEMTRIQAVKAIHPTIAGGWITMSNPSPRHPVEFLGPFWPLLVLNPMYTYLARRLGKLIAPLDPTPERRLWLYRRLNPDVILTDNPALTRRALAAGNWPGRPNRV